MRLLVSALFIFSSLVVYAQSGPGGVGNQDGENQQPKNILWLNVENLSLSDGDNIETWIDGSGNGNGLAASGNLSPFFENTSPLNGFGYAFFDQTTRPNTRMFRTNMGQFASLGNTTVLVVRTTDQDDAWVSYATIDDEEHMLIKNANDLEAFYTNNNSSSPGVDVNDGNWHIVLVAATSATGAVVFKVDGTETVGGVTSGFELDPNGTLWLGHQQGSINANPVSGAGFEGDIAEVISYNEFLSAVRRRILTNYLSAKFNIAITNDIYAGDDGANGDYDFDVAGIGQYLSTTHSIATSAGVTVDDEPNELDAGGEYILFGHNNASATVVDTPGDVQAGVEQRWNRDWYFDKTTSGSLGTRIAFDLEAVGGLFPQVADDYVLLRWNGSQYDTVSVGIANKEISGSAIKFTVSDGNFTDGRYTLGTTDATNSPVDGLSNKTWYAYQSGDWTNWQVWTLDGAEAPLLNNPNQEKPGAIDNVIIGSGKTVNVDSASFDLKSIQITGTLDMQDQTGHNFNTISGAGTLRISGSGGLSNFPAGDYSAFADGESGGTVEVYGTGLDITTDVLFNNARINLDNTSAVVEGTGNARINGNLEIVSGILRVNDATATNNLILDIYGNLVIESNGTLEVGSANARHDINLYGNFNNNGGTAKFTNRVAANYTAEATDGIIDLNFLDISGDQLMQVNGPTNFYRIEIDKQDRSNLVVAIASDPAYFNLFGPANYDHDTSIDQLVDNSALPDNQRNLNALGLYKGTFVAGNNIDIPKLSTGASTNYLVSAEAGILVSGGSITKDDGTSITTYGSLSILLGSLTGTCSDGLILKDQGSLNITNGTVTLNQLTTRDGVDGPTGQGQSLFMDGGTLDILGLGGNTGYKNLHFTHTGNVIITTAGQITVNGGDQAASRGIYINSAEDQVAASGGTAIFNLDQAGTFEITSTARLWNVEMTDSDGTGGNLFQLLAPFAVNADLLIENTPNNAALDANGFDLSIGSTLDIKDGATYTPNGNNTIFDGSLNGDIYLGTTSTQVFDGLDISKDASSASVTLRTGNATVAMQVDDELRVETGSLDYGSLIIESKSSIFVSDSLGSSGSTGRLVINGTTAQTISSESGTLVNVELDNNTGTNSLGLTLSGDMSVAGTLTMTNGVFDIDESKLRIAGANGSIVDGSGSGFDNTRMIMTTGLFGDGGLEHYVDANETILFPIGTDADVDGNIAAADEQRYTPATAVFSGFSDDGYVRFIPADGELATSLDPTRTLSFSWRVKHSDFTVLPTVVYTLVYDDEDGPTNNWNPPQPAKVVSGNRCQEIAGNISTGTNTITFNGDMDVGTCTDTGGAGFTLESGQYTAAKNNAFNGQLDTFYSWATDDLIMQWQDENNWSMDPDTYVAPTGSPKYPAAGDIAIIQSDGTNWHRMATYDGLDIAGVYFDNSDPAPGGQLPQLDVLSDNAVILNEVSGEGHIRLRVNPGGGADILPSISADIDGVLSETNSIIEYNATNENVVGFAQPTVTSTGTVVDLLTTITEYPNLYVGADADFDDASFDGDYPMRFTIDITANNMTVYNGGYLQTNSGAEGDVEITTDLSVGEGTDETVLEFNGSGNARTVTVNRDLNCTANSAILVEAGATGIEHFLRIGQNVNKDNTLFFESRNVSDDATITWEFFGAGNHSFVNTVLDEVSFDRLIINKGSDTTSTFTINTDFTLSGDNTDAANPVLELWNGKFIVNNSNIDIIISDGAGEIEIPSTAGLDLQAGRLATNGSAGVRLNGLLRISGGTFDTENSNSSSTGYIRASNTGAAKLEIQSGTLNLAGSIRRDIENNTMALNYNQTGGSVIVGINPSGINGSRGSLEVMGAQSTFNYTGGTLTVVHGNSTQIVPSLRFSAGSSNVTETIQIGSSQTTATGNETSIGISSTITLDGLNINSDGAAPEVFLYSSSVDLAGDLTISSGAILDANDNTLLIGGNMINNGQFIPKAGLVSFYSNGAQSISGSSTTSFWDLYKTGTGTLTLTKGIIVGDDLTINDGVLYDDGFTIDLYGNLIVIGDHSSNGGEGINMVGVTKQYVTGESGGTSVLGVLTINNTLGVEVLVNGYDFLINDKLRLEAGVFDIGGSLLEFSTAATIEEVNSFGLNNMIKTNNSFTDNGVLKNFPANYNVDFIFPIGETLYNPVSFDFGTGGSTSGTTAGSILVRPAAEPHPSVTGTDTSPTNQDNVLQFYWVIDGTALTDLSATISFQYNESQVSVLDPLYDETDYIGARYLSDNNPTNSVNKLGDIVDETNNLIQLTVSSIDDDGLSGDYFAGVDPAIQSAVSEYTTIASGNVDDPIYTPVVPGGGAPTGAIVNIENGHTVTFQLNSVNFYATDIRAGGEILVGETFGHRLGNVTGTGTLNLQSSTTNVVLPAGQYTAFFAPTGGILEYSGTGSYNILGSITGVRFLNLSGSGDRTMGSNNLTVYEDFTISGGDFTNPNNLTITVNGDMTISGGSYLNGTTASLNVAGNLTVSGGSFDGNSGGIKQITGNVDISSGSFDVGTGGAVRIGGNLTYSGGSFDGGSNQSVLSFNGTTPQSITGSMTGASALNNVTVNNTSTGLTLNNDVDVDGEFNFLDGLVHPGANKLLFTATASALPAEGTADSYVNGMLYKDLASGASFTFPIGGSGLWRYAGVRNTAGGAFQWSAQYFRDKPWADPLVDSAATVNPVAPLVTISLAEYWKISNNSTGGTGEVRLSWGTESDVSSVFAEREELVVVAWDDLNTEWDNFDGINFSSGHTVDQGDFYSALPVGFEERILTLGSTDASNPLPVELIYFRGNRNQLGILLSWKTAIEINNDYFEVQTSSDGENYTALAKVAGAGNSSLEKSYEWLHRSPIVGLNYYRLKQVDYDGNFEYSDPIAVMNETAISLFYYAYPQPASDQVTIDIISSNDRDPIRMAVINTNGSKQESFDLSPDQRSLTLDISGYRNGLYLIRLSQSSQVTSGKLLIQH